MRKNAPPGESGRPLVSVIMASYNYADCLPEAIASVAAQSYENWELLVVDDGSADGSPAIVEGFAEADARIRLLSHENGVNKGLPATVRLGLSQAQGEYAAFLESDDIWRRDCLEKRLARLAAADAAAVFNHVELLQTPGADIEGYRMLVQSPLRAYGGEGGSFSPERALLFQNPVPTFSCLMARTDVLRKCDFRSPVPRWLDWWLWLQIARQGNFAYIPEALTVWRIHSKSYNSKVAFRGYIRDAEAMWGGIRALYSGESRRSLRLFLALPFWAPLFARLWSILRGHGLAGLIGRVRGRLRPY